MLDSDTKHRIDNARDILVGKIPDPKTQVEQITFAMIYKFMDDMDQQSVEMGGQSSFFTNSYEQYAWSKLMDKRMLGAQRLDLYVRALEAMNQNPFIPQLFRDIFKGAFLPYRDAETLNLFLKEMDGFHYTHSEDLGDAYEYLLAIFATQGKAGQFRTPRHIIDFIVKCVNPTKTDTVLDPACGTAGFLISAYKHILTQNAETPLSGDERERLTANFVGYDISPDMVRLSRVNMYLHQFPNPTIYEYDTLTTEDRWDDTFDIILANPPFMTPKGGIRPHTRFAVQANRSEVLFVDYIAEHLNPDGRAGVIVPEGIIFQSSNAYKALRKMLVEGGYLYAVVSLPAGIFQPYSGVKTSVLMLDKTLARRTDKVLFVKVEADGFDLGAQRREIEPNDLPEALKMVHAFQADPQSEPPNQTMAHAVEKSRLAEDDDYNLSGQRYRLVVVRDHKWPMVALGEIAQEIKSGFASGKSEIDGIGLPHLRPMNISIEGKLVWEGTKYLPEEYFLDKEQFNLVKNDILFNNTNSKELVGKTCLVSEDIHGGYSNHLTRIRTKPTVYNARLLAYILHGYWRKGYFINICNRWVGQAGINNTKLALVKIPFPSLDIQQAIVVEIEGYQKIIDGARQVVENYKPIIHIDPAWPLVKLGEVCETTSGGTPLRSILEFYQGGTIPWLRSGEVRQGNINHSEMFITEEGFMNSSAKMLPSNTVLVAMYGATAGQVGILKFESTTNQAICGILPNDNFIPEFIYYFLQSKTDDLVNISGGGAQPNISQKIIKEISIPMPNIPTQQSIVNELEQEQSIIEANKSLIARFEAKIAARIKSVWEEG